MVFGTADIVSTFNQFNFYSSNKVESIGLDLNEHRLNYV
jgi:hypothetical protein